MAILSAVPDRMSGGHVPMHAALYAYEDAIFNPKDDQRVAALGSVFELPSLGECLAAWRQRIAEEQPLDFEAQIKNLWLLASGNLSAGKPGEGLPMTYRAFGTLLRQWTKPPPNVARVLSWLTVNPPPAKHSPRSCAYNDYLRRNKSDASVMLRTRLIAQKRVVIAAVSKTHSLEHGDDRALIGALTMAFTGHAKEARASAYRGIEVSEIRVVFPTMEVEVPGTGSERWAGYITARNSEVCTSSWNISAGLYRRTDGASVACEAIGRRGRHSGTKVGAKMVDAAESAADMLRMLMQQAAKLASVPAPWEMAETLRRVKAACEGTPAATEENTKIITDTIQRSILGAFRVGQLIEVLGRIAAHSERRNDSLALEILMGRLLMNGWSSLHAVEIEGVES